MALSESAFIVQGDTSSEDTSSISEDSQQAEKDLDFDLDWDFISYLISDNSAEIIEQGATLHKA